MQKRRSEGITGGTHSHEREQAEALRQCEQLQGSRPAKGSAPGAQVVYRAGTRLQTVLCTCLSQNLRRPGRRRDKRRFNRDINRRSHASRGASLR